MREDVDVYAAADKAIQEMNRDAQRDFRKLALADWDEVNVIQTVSRVYRTQAKKARRKYYEVAFEGYLMALYLYELYGKDAYRMADDALTAEWLDMLLGRPDPVTKYSFDAETERKATRLAEAIEASPAPAQEVEKALRYWSKQLGQYAINATDEAMMQAYEDAGVEEVMWLTAEDERVCAECGPRHGKIYPIDKVPPKPHWGCRCILVPVKRSGGKA